MGRPNEYREPNSFYQAKIEFTRGNYEETVRLLITINKDDSDYLSSQVRLAKAYMKLRRWEKAERCVRIVMSRESTRPTYNIRGELFNIRYIICRHTGKDKEAEYFFNKYLEKNPNANLGRNLLIVNKSMGKHLMASGFKVVTDVEGLNRVDWMSVEVLIILYELKWYNPSEIIRGGYKLLCSLLKKRIDYTGMIGMISNSTNTIKESTANKTYTPFMKALRFHRVDLNATDWDSRLLANPYKRGFQILQEKFNRGFLRENKNLPEKDLHIHRRGKIIPIKIIRNANGFDIIQERIWGLGFSKIASSPTEDEAIDTIRSEYLGLSHIDHLDDPYKSW